MAKLSPHFQREADRYKAATPAERKIMAEARRVITARKAAAQIKKSARELDRSTREQIAEARWRVEMLRQQCRALRSKYARATAAQLAHTDSALEAAEEKLAALRQSKRTE